MSSNKPTPQRPTAAERTEVLEELLSKVGLAGLVTLDVNWGAQGSEVCELNWIKVDDKHRRKGHFEQAMCVFVGYLDRSKLNASLTVKPLAEAGQGPSVETLVGMYQMAGFVKTGVSEGAMSPMMTRVHQTSTTTYKRRFRRECRLHAAKLYAIDSPKMAQVWLQRARNG